MAYASENTTSSTKYCGGKLRKDIQATAIEVSEFGLHLLSHFIIRISVRKMVIYPNGDGDGRNHISIYLAIVGTDSLPADWEVNATFSFFLFDQIHDSYVVIRGMQRCFRNIKTEWGVPKFILHATFKEPSNGYLVNDKCILGVDVYVIRNQLVGECMSSLNVIQPYKHEWKISEFSKLTNIVYSEVFTVGGHKWGLWLYPTGYGDQNGQSISIFLVSLDAKGFDCQKRVQAKFSISVKNQITGVHCQMTVHQHWFAVDTPHSWGWSKFMALSEFKDPKKGFLVNDCCTVEAEVSVLHVINGLS